MKRSSAIVGLCLAAGFLVYPQDDTLVWENNYRAALEEARRSQKPIFLEYRCEP